MPLPSFQTEKVASPEVEEEVRELLSYHKLTDPQIEKGQAVREQAIQLVLTIIRNVPPGPDRTVAIRKIREAVMDANSCITHNGRF
jgi:hypothetical protein